METRLKEETMVLPHRTINLELVGEWENRSFYYWKYRMTGVSRGPKMMAAREIDMICAELDRRYGVDYVWSSKTELIVRQYIY